MARYEITAPGGGYDEDVAGIAFTGGRAIASDPDEGALLYFRRHGYTVEVLDGPPAAKPAGRSRSRRKEE